MRYRRLAAIDGPEQFRAYAGEVGAELPFDPEVMAGSDSPLAQTYELSDGFVVGNRWCCQPMEGWDGTRDGRPTELTRRRWRRFGASGAKLIWGGEAVAVAHQGRGNPRQLLICERNLGDLADLRRELVAAHRRAFGGAEGLLVGLQLTHSGRFSRPSEGKGRQPKILYRHPLLDRRFDISPDHPVLTDEEIEHIIGRFVDAAEMAREAGFGFVDIKHCHGYLGHEFLSAYSRPGPFGGSFENRTRFLRQVVEGIRGRVPDLRIGVRLSAFDTLPFRPGTDGRGTPEQAPVPYPHAFGVDVDDPLEPDLEEPRRFLSLLGELGIGLVNLSAGAPYYNPHVTRPALYPPTDGYEPPEDPLLGVARQIGVVRRLKEQFPHLAMVGSAYTYLQEWLPHVAQAAVSSGAVDFVGLGRMMLSYPALPADVLAGRPLDRKRICRTFSDCTTSARLGLPSGCYPLDAFYRDRPEAAKLERPGRR